MVEFLHTSLQLTNIIRKIKDDMYEMWCFVFEKARIEISHECDEYHMVSWYLMVSCRRTHQNQRFSYTSRVFFLGFGIPILSFFTEELFIKEETNNDYHTTQNDDAASYWQLFVV